MKRTAAIVGAVLGLTAGLAIAGPLPLQGRDINGNPVGATDASAVFEYDPNLNMTWLRDWNYAKTSGYANASPDGQMSWDTAKIWASTLKVGNFSGWSLPTITDTAAKGCNFAYSGTDCGFNMFDYWKGATSTSDPKLSPMAYLWYVELGNKAIWEPTSPYPGTPTQQDGWGLSNVGPFQNMDGNYYWSGTEYGYPEKGAWHFNPLQGSQFYHAKNNVCSETDYPKGCPTFAVAVQPGDLFVASVPEPGTVALLTLSLGALGLVRKRRSV
jgi:hypothetical protein